MSNKPCPCGPNDGCPECTKPAAPKPLGEELVTRNYAADVFMAQSRFLLGKVLTVVEASFPDKEQRKAVKDLVKQQFYEQQKHASEVLTGVRMLCAGGERMPPYAVSQNGPLVALGTEVTLPAAV